MREVTAASRAWMTPSDSDLSLDAALGALPPILLSVLQETADLQTRVDRKYVVPASTAAGLLWALAGTARVLQIDGDRAFRYESVYFDTPDLRSYHEAAHGRRRRFKVRTRVYLDSDVCALELKRRGGRGETVKLRLPYQLEDRDTLSGEGRQFLVREGLSPAAAAGLVPTLVTSYRRSTVVADGVRITIDQDLRCHRHGAHGEVGETECALASGRVVLETKSVGGRSPADRWLWAHGTRPVALSKYCTGLAALTPSLPANKWHRTVAAFEG